MLRLLLLVLYRPGRARSRYGSLKRNQSGPLNPTATSGTTFRPVPSPTRFALTATAIREFGNIHARAWPNQVARPPVGSPKIGTPSDSNTYAARTPDENVRLLMMPRIPPDGRLILPCFMASCRL